MYKTHNKRNKFNNLIQQLNNLYNIETKLFKLQTKKHARQLVTLVLVFIYRVKYNICTHIKMSR